MNPSLLLARALKSLAGVEPHELSAVMLSMLYFFFLFGSYSVVKPVRDAMGTVYGIKHLNELFLGTFIGTLILAPLYAGMASRLKLSTFLPWVYGFIALTILGFYALFSGGKVSDRWVAAGFYIWVSVFNMLIISVFWSFMADIFSRTQAKRLFGFIAAGGTVGGIAGPAIATLLAKRVGNNGLMLISAGGLRGHGLPGEAARARSATSWSRPRAARPSAPTSITAWAAAIRSMASSCCQVALPAADRRFPVPDDLRSPPSSTRSSGDLITKAFTDHNARTQAYATIELAVNSLAVVIQLIGTGRIIKRFGVTLGLMLNPIIMVFAFLAIAFSPVLMILGSLQVLRRVAEYAVAKPTPRNAVHRRGPGKQVQGQERHRHGGLPRRRPGRLLRQCRCAQGLRRHRSCRPGHRRVADLVPDRLGAGQALRERAQRRGRQCRGGGRRPLTGSSGVVADWALFAWGGGGMRAAYYALDVRLTYRRRCGGSVMSYSDLQSIANPIKKQAGRHAKLP